MDSGWCFHDHRRYYSWVPWWWFHAYTNDSVSLHWVLWLFWMWHIPNQRWMIPIILALKYHTMHVPWMKMSILVVEQHVMRLVACAASQNILICTACPLGSGVLSGNGSIASEQYSCHSCHIQSMPDRSLVCVSMTIFKCRSFLTYAKIIMTWCKWPSLGQEEKQAINEAEWVMSIQLRSTAQCKMPI